ncbi:MAG: cytochrome C peroxidase [SAR324 cluster bacterium]|uniref:Cytochrome C peroxidase n=1 Tax=SAR324 cluster bacterium TaxID=2024889 RepID=A0A2A4T4D6_9DELT|nr:MAG: cytochrome C peroxidase [SAR324 cluster bacterium]
MKRFFGLFTVFFLMANSIILADPLMKTAQQLFKPIPTFPQHKVENPATLPKLELGKMLYFEPRISSSGLLSCNTCHNVGLGGIDLQETSIGHGWAKGPRNAPTVLNAVFNIAQFWDGRAKDLEQQAKGPVQASVEMNATPARVEKTLQSIPRYVQMFQDAFPGQKDPVTFDNMAKVIEVFEATLITPDSQFDRYLLGDKNALNREEQTGLELFINKGCSSCHNGVNIGGSAYYKFGVVKMPNSKILPAGDKGRYAVTKNKDDEYVFRAGTLRNIELTAPYFHSGTVFSLKEAVSIMGTAQLGIELSDRETNHLVTFLKTLTGKQPDMKYPILPPSTDATPRPQWN